VLKKKENKGRAGEGGQVIDDVQVAGALTPRDHLHFDVALFELQLRQPTATLHRKGDTGNILQVVVVPL
jgi:hypothetical protein